MIFKPNQKQIKQEKESLGNLSSLTKYFIFFFHFKRDYDWCAVCFWPFKVINLMLNMITFILEMAKRNENPSNNTHLQGLNNLILSKRESKNIEE